LNHKKGVYKAKANRAPIPAAKTRPLTTTIFPAELGLVEDEEGEELLEEAEAEAEATGDPLEAAADAALEAELLLGEPPAAATVRLPTMPPSQCVGTEQK